MTALSELTARLRAEGGLLAAHAAEPAPGATAALGEAAAAGDPAYALLVEAIREGELQHYGGGRVLAPATDPDLALLAGDHLYTLGLAELAARGDLASVTALAGVIARCAQAHAEGRPQDAQDVWREGVEAVAGRAGM